MIYTMYYTNTCPSLHRIILEFLEWKLLGQNLLPVWFCWIRSAILLRIHADTAHNLWSVVYFCGLLLFSIRTTLILWNYLESFLSFHIFWHMSIAVELPLSTLDYLSMRDSSCGFWNQCLPCHSCLPTFWLLATQATSIPTPSFLAPQNPNLHPQL